MKKQLFAGLVAAALTVGIASTALAAPYAKSLTLGNNMSGNFAFTDVAVGDEVTLTLINPTNQDLVFHTDAAFGTAETWTVPANSQRQVKFAYATPFSNDVSYTVDTTTGNRIASGVLFDLPALTIRPNTNVDAGRISTDNEDGGQVIDSFRRTITLGSNSTGNFQIDDLGIGDKVELTLVNPTAQPLTFRTNAMLGPERSWVIPANSQRQVSFTYDRPFSDEVSFDILGANQSVVSHGVLFNSTAASATSSSSSSMTSATSIQQSSQSTTTTTAEQEQTAPVDENSSTVRGFW